MNHEQNSLQVKTIALDFYDGVTEGFTISIKDLGISYFKLIAWDETQDQRLFVVIPIERQTFDTIFKLLSLSNDPPHSPVWLPKWIFKNDQDETQANEVIDACLSDIKSKGILMLGNEIENLFYRNFAINDSLVESIHKAIKEPERLQIWLNKMKVD